MINSSINNNKYIFHNDNECNLQNNREHERLVKNTTKRNSKNEFLKHRKVDFM